MVYGVRAVSDVTISCDVGIVFDVRAVCGVGTVSDVRLVHHVEQVHGGKLNCVKIETAKLKISSLQQLCW